MFEAPSSAPVEKPKPILNEEGRVEDEDIARGLAQETEDLRNGEVAKRLAKAHRVDVQTYIDNRIDRRIDDLQESQDALHKEQMLLMLSQKIAESLSEEERKLIGDAIRNRDLRIERVFSKMQ